MSLKIKPLLDKIVLEELKEKPKSQTKTGIIIPSLTPEQKTTAKVIAVGKGSWINGKRQELDVKVGDTVIYSKYGAIDFELDGKIYKIIKQNDILAIIE